MPKHKRGRGRPCVFSDARASRGHGHLTQTTTLYCLTEHASKVPTLLSHGGAGVDGGMRKNTSARMDGLVGHAPKERISARVEFGTIMHADDTSYGKFPQLCKFSTWKWDTSTRDCLSRTLRRCWARGPQRWRQTLLPSIARCHVSLFRHVYLRAVSKLQE